MLECLIVLMLECFRSQYTQTIKQSDNQTIYNMTPEEIIKELEQQQQLLNNYLDLTTDMEDDASYIARGNGFCDAKYSEDFLQGQTEKIRKRIAELQRSLQ